MYFISFSVYFILKLSILKFFIYIYVGVQVRGEIIPQGSEDPRVPDLVMASARVLGSVGPRFLVRVPEKTHFNLILGFFLQNYFIQSKFHIFNWSTGPR